MKLYAEVNRGCGGANRDCGDADDLPLDATGWGDVAACPGFESNGCTGAITNCVDISACLECIAGAAVDQAVAAYAGEFDADAFGTSGVVNRCQQAINKGASKFIEARSKLLQKCWDARLRNGHQNECPDPGDGKTVALLEKAEARKVSTICKACGGPDGLCDGKGDLSPAEIGFAATCPAVSPRGGSNCSRSIQDLTDLVACVDCVAEFKTDCADAAAVPELLIPYPAACNASVTSTTSTTTSTTSTTMETTTTTVPTTTSTTIETTTTTSTSTAPTTTTTTTTGPSTTTTVASTTTTSSTTTTTTIPTQLTCGPSGRFVVTVTLDYPALTVNLAGMTVLLDYPSQVSIPGSGLASSVNQRVTRLIGLPSGTFTFLVADVDSMPPPGDDRLRTLVTANRIPPGPIEAVSFDCSSGTVVQTANFTCGLEGLSDNEGLLSPSDAAQVRCLLSFNVP